MRFKPTPKTDVVLKGFSCVKEQKDRTGAAPLGQFMHQIVNLRLRIEQFSAGSSSQSLHQEIGEPRRSLLLLDLR